MAKNCDSVHVMYVTLCRAFDCSLSVQMNLNWLWIKLDELPTNSLLLRSELTSEIKVSHLKDVQL